MKCIVFLYICIPGKVDRTLAGLRDMYLSGSDQTDWDTGQGHFSQSTGEEENFRGQKNTTLSFLKMDMRHSDTPPLPPISAPTYGAWGERGESGGCSDRYRSSSFFFNSFYWV